MVDGARDKIRFCLQEHLKKFSDRGYALPDRPGAYYPMSDLNLGGRAAGLPFFDPQSYSKHRNSNIETLALRLQNFEKSVQFGKLQKKMINFDISYRSSWHLWSFIISTIVTYQFLLIILLLLLLLLLLLSLLLLLLLFSIVNTIIIIIQYDYYYYYYYHKLLLLLLSLF